LLSEKKGIPNRVFPFCFLLLPKGVLQEGADAGMAGEALANYSYVRKCHPDPVGPYPFTKPVTPGVAARRRMRQKTPEKKPG
jgi:hypothetical protein